MATGQRHVPSSEKAPRVNPGPGGGRAAIAQPVTPLGRGRRVHAGGPGRGAALSPLPAWTQAAVAFPNQHLSSHVLILFWFGKTTLNHCVNTNGCHRS